MLGAFEGEWKKLIHLFKASLHIPREMIVRMILIFVCACFVVERYSCLSIHDPRLSPGHLKPLGTGRPKHPIESALDYPSPQGSLVYCPKQYAWIVNASHFTAGD